MNIACTRWSLLAVPVLAALGCSDAVPLPSQGAVTLDIQSVAVNVNGTSCPIPAKTYQVFAPGGTSPSPGDPGTKPVIDGDSGASVTCSVSGSGSGPYTFSALLSAISTEGQHITVTLTDGMVDTTGSGTVGVSVYTPDLLSNFSSGSTPCTVTVRLGSDPQVKPGKPGSILATFECPTITSPPSGLCGVGTSTILLGNCNG